MQRYHLRHTNIPFESRRPGGINPHNLQLDASLHGFPQSYHYVISKVYIFTWRHTFEHTVRAIGKVTIEKVYCAQWGYSLRSNDRASFSFPLAALWGCSPGQEKRHAGQNTTRAGSSGNAVKLGCHNVSTTSDVLRYFNTDHRYWSNTTTLGCNRRWLTAKITIWFAMSCV